ncbi:MAG: hypothetical protein HFE45_08995 [Oscillospiraceae bacterium]|jgi:hypothetical protein|nr:hypothetical protein [Oscillospiraceae bacterium]
MALDKKLRSEATGSPLPPEEPAPAPAEAAGMPEAKPFQPPSVDAQPAEPQPPVFHQAEGGFQESYPAPPPAAGRVPQGGPNAGGPGYRIPAQAGYENYTMPAGGYSYMSQIPQAAAYPPQGYAAQPVYAPAPSDVAEALMRIEGQLSMLAARVEASGVNGAVLQDSLAAVERQLAALAKPNGGVQDRLVGLSRQLSAMAASKSDSSLAERLAGLEQLVAGIAEKQDRNDRQLAQDLRENANFRVQVRQGMQHDLDTLRAEQSGEKFDPILKEIAAVYSDYQTLLNEELPERARKNLAALFEQLEDLLLDYGAEKVCSEAGSARQPRLCKIIGKIPTADKEKHNTIAASRKPGVIRGRVVLYQELVDVYIYDPGAAPEAAPSPEPAEPPVSEEAPAGQAPADTADGAAAPQAL